VTHSLFIALGYHDYWFSAKKKGYSGVAVFTRFKPDHVEYGFFEYLEGLRSIIMIRKVIRTTPDFFRRSGPRFPSVRLENKGWRIDHCPVYAELSLG
jgi:exonuclease III